MRAMYLFGYAIAIICCSCSGSGASSQQGTVGRASNETPESDSSDSSNLEGDAGTGQVEAGAPEAETSPPDPLQLLGPLELPFEWDDSEGELSPAQQQILDLYVSGLEEEERRGWGIRVVSVDQPWVPEVRWALLTGYDANGHRSLPTQWFGIEDGRLVSIVLGGERQSLGTTNVSQARSFHTCPWDSNVETPASSEQLESAQCRDHTPQLLTSFYARARSDGFAGEAKDLVRSLSSLLRGTSAVAQVIESEDRIPARAQWIGGRSRFRAPTVTESGGVVQARGLLFARGGFSRPILSFNMSMSEEELQLNVRQVGSERVLIR